MISLTYRQPNSPPLTTKTSGQIAAERLSTFLWVQNQPRQDYVRSVWAREADAKVRGGEKGSGKEGCWVVANE
jgi:hypothetical protein